MLVTWDRSVPIPLVQEGADRSTSPDPDRRISCLWIAGFIANKAEMLELAGLPANSSDQQLLTTLFERYATDVFKRIAGPCASVIWDASHQFLVAARDRVGTYALYYAVQGKTVLIANRVETLLGSLSFKSALNPRSIVAQINSEAPLDGETFYESIKAIDPGGLLTVSDQSISVSRYWRVEPQPTLNLASDADYADAFRHLLFRVAAEYVPSNPAGVTLSSGMDSTSVASAIRAVAPDIQLTGFSWVAPELPDADESPYLSGVSHLSNVPLVTIRSDLFWTLSNPDGVTTRAGTPFYNYYTELWDETFRTICQHGIHVVFSGASGDHLFGGNIYPYADFLLTGRWLKLARQIHVILPYSGMHLKGLVRNLVLAPIFQVYSPFPQKRPVPWLHKQYHGLYQECFGRADEFSVMLPGRKQRLLSLRDRLLPHILEGLSIQAAKYSIELRHLLIDHRLIEFALSLATERTFNGMNTKFVMRNAMRGYLPDSIVDQYFKITPETIARRGLREREQVKVWKLLRNMKAAELGFVDEKKIQATYQDYCAGKHQNEEFWYTVTLEDWLRRYS